MLFPDLVDYARDTCAPYALDGINETVAKAAQVREHIRKNGVFTVMKSDGDEGESGTGGFLDYEEVMAVLMMAAWSRKTSEAYDAYLDALGGTYTAAKMNRGAEVASRILSDVVTEDDAVAMRAAQVQAARRGASVANGLTAFDQLPTNEQIFDGMTRASRYWTNAYFNNHVIPALQRSVENLIASEGLTDPKAVYQALRSQLDQRLLRRVPYWHTVSSSAASRAYHYGIIKAGRRVGYRGYRLEAVMDNRTSDICRTLNGREFWLADAERVYDDIAKTEGDDIKDVHPWISREEYKGMSEREVYDRAVYVPPFHGRCRTTMRLIYV